MPTVDTPAPLRRQLDETVRAIASRTAFRPTLGLIVGSGLGGMTKALHIEAEIPYADLPYMSEATAPGHEGKLVLGTLGRQRLGVLAGRLPYYEGDAIAQVTYPLPLIPAWGADPLVLTSIGGSMKAEMPTGSLVLLEDHVNLMGANPLLGPNDDALGPRFPDMSAPYDAGLRRLALQVATEQGIPLREGVYVAVAGPNLETRAEYRMLRQYADVIGMSVVPEVLVARHS